MASLCDDGNSKWRIMVGCGDGKRRPVRLGKMSKRQAEGVKAKVRDLEAARMTGQPPSDATGRWLATIDDKLHAKLAKVGLVKERESATVAEFTRKYIDGRGDIKPRTRINLERVRNYLLDAGLGDKPMRSATTTDAADFRQHLVRTGRGRNTIARAIGRSRQFFTEAMKRGFVEMNPFAGMSARVRGNPDRMHFVDRSVIEDVVNACRTNEWKLIFALARYGGLRCPSEVLALKWSDVDLLRRRMRVRSPKTEGQGKPWREVPIFAELHPYLAAMREEAPRDAEFVISTYQGRSGNIRTQALRIIRRAGVEAWPKPFQNLRSTRQTEIERQFGHHLACAWIGNTLSVAAEHYLQVTDEDFDRATRVEAAQNAAQKLHAAAGNGVKASEADHEKTPVFAGASADVRVLSVPRRGLEPLLPP